MRCEAERGQDNKNRMHIL